MRRFRNLPDLFTAFLQDRSGTTAIEYAIIAGGIALVIVAAVSAVGLQSKANLESAANGFN